MSADNNNNNNALNISRNPVEALKQMSEWPKDDPRLRLLQQLSARKFNELRLKRALCGDSDATAAMDVTFMMDCNINNLVIPVSTKQFCSVGDVLEALKGVAFMGFSTKESAYVPFVVVDSAEFSSDTPLIMLPDDGDDDELKGHHILRLWMMEEAAAAASQAPPQKEKPNKRRRASTSSSKDKDKEAEQEQPKPKRVRKSASYDGDLFAPPYRDLPEISELKGRISSAIVHLYHNGEVRKAPHLHWVIDQTLRKLCKTEKEYEHWVHHFEAHPDRGSFKWNTGVAPGMRTKPDEYQSRVDYCRAVLLELQRDGGKHDRELLDTMLRVLCDGQHSLELDEPGPRYRKWIYTYRSIPDNKDLPWPPYYRVFPRPLSYTEIMTQSPKEHQHQVVEEEKEEQAATTPVADESMLEAAYRTGTADNIPMPLRVKKALDCIVSYGDFDGGHHKQWVLDQVVRILVGGSKPAYKHWLEAYGLDEDGDPEWDRGCAP